MKASADDVTRYSQQIRLSFQLLKRLGETLHADLGIALSLRAILEYLADHGSQTVPQIADAKSVSRQHVQKSVDELLARGFVSAAANPAHKRSVLIALTHEGQKVFKTMQKREAGVIAEIAARSDGDGQRQALKHLADFNAALRTLIQDRTNDPSA